ncbi:hypothetical protein IE81DRAFT_181673 [Ceraceosorus guamensis]|uniref:Uncharacterized protein n=1 Tax=Ceraceosorus guamensis TaxID=1522189 RepID=A0A316VUH9_9BASI|nr:hypothetical protein IE81DRAFT_181673 [Ceraceosorus guamensis]PWN41237.1 hypothetical protein IE81DRAFT_181673 [Ceraceosorus guamensis]
MSRGCRGNHIFVNVLDSKPFSFDARAARAVVIASSITRDKLISLLTTPSLPLTRIHILRSALLVGLYVQNHALEVIRNDEPVGCSGSAKVTSSKVLYPLPQDAILTATQSLLRSDSHGRRGSCLSRASIVDKRDAPDQATKEGVCIVRDYGQVARVHARMRSGHVLATPARVVMISKFSRPRGITPLSLALWHMRDLFVWSCTRTCHGEERIQTLHGLSSTCSLAHARSCSCLTTSCLATWRGVRAKRIARW